MEQGGVERKERYISERDGGDMAWESKRKEENSNEWERVRQASLSLVWEVIQCFEGFLYGYMIIKHTKPLKHLVFN